MLPRGTIGWYGYTCHTVRAINTTITVTGASKEQVGAVSAKIRSYREPQPYLGKGVRYSDETIRRNAGKAAGK